MPMPGVPDCDVAGSTDATGDPPPAQVEAPTATPIYRTSANSTKGGGSPDTTGVAAAASGRAQGHQKGSGPKGLGKKHVNLSPVPTEVAILHAMPHAVPHTAAPLCW